MEENQEGKVGGREGQDSEGRRKIWWSGEDGTESGRVRAWHVV